MFCPTIYTLRAESPSIFLDKSGRGRRLESPSSSRLIQDDRRRLLAGYIIYGPPLYTHFSALLFPAQGSESHTFAFWGLASLYKTTKHPPQCMLLHQCGTSCQRDSLRGSLPKSVPPDFGLDKTFALCFCHQYYYPS